MNLFKFTPVSSPTILEQGQAINGYTSSMWVERYSDPGEFEIKAPLSSGLREFLPLGTLISKIDSYEIMIVENHEITEDFREDPILTITGRSFEVYLENRIVGTNLVRTSSTIDEYVLAASVSAAQAVKLINDHIVNTRDVNDSLVNVLAQTAINTGTVEARNIARGNVHSRLLEILAVDDLGVRSIRSNGFGVVGTPNQTVLSIYQGNNKSHQVIFSWKEGDLKTAEYLFTSKRKRTSAMVVGRYVYVMVDLAPTRYNRRTIMVNATDIDGYLNNVPTGALLNDILAKMRVRGNQTLRRFNNITISRADISNITDYEFRKDYDIGDWISLDGNFGQIAVCRVVEYAEVEDENGVSGHPTLSFPGPDDSTTSFSHTEA